MIRALTLAAMLTATTAHGGGYIAPTIPYPVTVTPIAGVTTPGGSNAGWWIVGGAIVLCLLLCRGNDKPRTVTEPPTPAPVPIAPAGLLLATGIGGLAMLRRKRKASK